MDLLRMLTARPLSGAPECIILSHIAYLNLKRGAPLAKAPCWHVGNHGEITFGTLPLKWTSDNLMTHEAANDYVRRLGREDENTAWLVYTVRAE